MTGAFRSHRPEVGVCTAVREEGDGSCFRRDTRGSVGAGLGRGKTDRRRHGCADALCIILKLFCKFEIISPQLNFSLNVKTKHSYATTK